MVTTSATSVGGGLVVEPYLAWVAPAQPPGRPDRHEALLRSESASRRAAPSLAETAGGRPGMPPRRSRCAGSHPCERRSPPAREGQRARRDLPSDTRLGEAPDLHP